MNGDGILPKTPLALAVACPSLEQYPVTTPRHKPSEARAARATANDDGTSYLARGSNVVLQHGLERCEHRDTACVGATDGAFTVLETQAKDGRVDILRLRASTSHTATHMQ